MSAKYYLKTGCLFNLALSLHTYEVPDPDITVRAMKVFKIGKPLRMRPAWITIPQYCIMYG